jgi:putative membrane protein insertion efficiency factor
MVRVFQWLVKVYSYMVSPLLGRNCRYLPTCSCFMNEALEKHGLFKGLFLGMKRILACNPWSKRDFHDPVPKRFAWRDVLGYKRSQSNIENKER